MTAGACAAAAGTVLLWIIASTASLRFLLGCGEKRVKVEPAAVSTRAKNKNRAVEKKEG